MIAERNYFWDNVKAFLILCVVMGHALEGDSLKTDASVFVDTLIYSFHMPAFIFVSGFFAKRYCTDGKVRAEKAVTLFAYYIIFQILFTVICTLLNVEVNISLFEPRRGLWYLLTLFVLYLLTPIIEKLPAWLVLPISVVFALMVINDESSTTFLSIARLFTFAPYYFAGYYIGDKQINKLRSLKAYVRIPIGIACVAASVSMWLFDLNHPWNKLFYGKASNVALEMDFWQATFVRLEVYLIASLMIFALLLIVPSKKSIIAKVGQNSLQVYIFHMMLVIVLFDSGIIELSVDNDWILALLMLIAVAVTALFSLDVFAYPFKWIQTGVKKLCINNSSSKS